MKLKNLDINELTKFVIKNIDETVKFSSCSTNKNIGILGFEIMLTTNEFVPISLVCSKNEIRIFSIPEGKLKSNKWNNFSYETLNKNWKEFLFSQEEISAPTL